jgi:hypothetical protein
MEKGKRRRHDGEGKREKGKGKREKGKGEREKKGGGEILKKRLTFLYQSLYKALRRHSKTAGSAAKFIWAMFCRNTWPLLVKIATHRATLAA